MSIYQPVMGCLESEDQVVQADGVACLERQLSFDDIALCFFVAGNKDLSYYIRMSGIRNTGVRLGKGIRIKKK